MTRASQECSWLPNSFLDEFSFLKCPSACIYLTLSTCTLCCSQVGRKQKRLLTPTSDIAQSNRLTGLIHTTQDTRASQYQFLPFNMHSISRRLTKLPPSAVSDAISVNKCLVSFPSTNPENQLFAAPPDSSVFTRPSESFEPLLFLHFLSLKHDQSSPVRSAWTV